MNSLVERLRAWGPLVSGGYECPAAGTAMHEAAARIEQLEKALDKMKRSRDRYRQAWEAEKTRAALEEK